jgi:hypothetical protein
MGGPGLFDGQVAAVGTDRRRLLLGLAAACCVGTGAGAVGTLALRTGRGEARLMEVSPDERHQAEQAVGPIQAREEGQKACREPIAFVTVAAVSSITTPSFFQIRSGTYISPRFELSGPKRIAIPFPAPYREGRGTISLIGSGKNLAISLSPTWYVEQLDGELLKPVFWSIHQECG